MSKKLILILALSLILISIFAGDVSAARDGIISKVLEPVIGDNFGETYYRFSTFIDMVIYLILFLGLVQLVLGERFQGKGSQALTVGMGIVLSVSLALFEKAAGFNLLAFGPIALVIIVGIFSFAAYEVLHGKFGMSKTSAGALAYIFGSAIILTAFGMVMSNSGVLAESTKKILDTDTAELVVGLITLGMLAAILIVGYWVFSHIWKKKDMQEQDIRPETTPSFSRNNQRNLRRLINDTRNEIIDINKITEPINKALAIIKEIQEKTSRSISSEDMVKYLIGNVNGLIKNINDLKEKVKDLERVNQRILREAGNLIAGRKNSESNATDEAFIVQNAQEIQQKIDEINRILTFMGTRNETLKGTLEMMNKQKRINLTQELNNDLNEENAKSENGLRFTYQQLKEIYTLLRQMFVEEQNVSARLQE